MILDLGLETFWPDLSEALSIGAAMLKLTLVVAGLALLGITCASFKRTWPAGAFSACAMLGGLIAAFTITQSAGEHIRFAFFQSHYEHRLSKILAHDPKEGTATREYRVDEGPPFRVAFIWERGLIDNWVGLVYDPSGAVMEANAFKRDASNWSDPSLQKIKRLFGGDIYRAKHLRGQWYLCWFT